MMSVAVERMSQRIVVGMADARIVTTPEQDLVTYALGSCVGVAIYDPEVGVGGMLHAMLPLSSIAPEKASANPWMFVDTGVPWLFREAYRHGAAKERLKVYAVGGAHVHGVAGRTEEDDQFQIGKRNVTMLRKLLWRNGVLLAGHDLGGEVWRTVSLRMDSGELHVISNQA
ncbi:MAG: chemotaxis protein CheD [Sandaracinaceae bacterium]|nr:chemotaxis protein CheD [Sandaracinaceae bacterium]